MNKSIALAALVAITHAAKLRLRDGEGETGNPVDVPVGNDVLPE